MRVIVDGVFEGGDRAADVDRGGWLVGVQEWAQEPVLEFGVEDGDADPVGGEDVACCLCGHAPDEAVEAQAPQVVAHLAGGVVAGRGVRRRAREGFCW